MSVPTSEYGFVGSQVEDTKAVVSEAVFAAFSSRRLKSGMLDLNKTRDNWHDPTLFLAVAGLCFADSAAPNMCHVSRVSPESVK